VQDPYEPPLSPEILINTDNEVVDKNKNIIIEYLLKKNYIWIEENDNPQFKFNE
jgi:adenylylsulfate kinase-like enzyme